MDKFPHFVVAATVLASCCIHSPIAMAEELEGSVTKVDVPGGIGTQAEKLTDTAMDRDETAQFIKEKVKEFSTIRHKALVAAKEAAASVVPYRGFLPSRDGSTILLEQVKKVKTLAAAEYLPRTEMRRQFPHQDHYQSNADIRGPRFHRRGRRTKTH